MTVQTQFFHVMEQKVEYYSLVKKSSCGCDSKIRNSLKKFKKLIKKH